MSEALKNPVDTIRQPKFIYVTGADGVGKSTLTTLLVSQLQEQSFPVRRVWLRFPQLTSIPFLIYARLRGFSYYEEINGVRYGYWDFRQSWMMQRLFPWFVWFDALLFSLLRIYLPYITGRSIVCERYTLDMLVDLAVALDDPSFWKRYPGKLFFRLIPPGAEITILDLDAATIRQRRPALETDHYLEKRLTLYRQLAADCGFTVISTQQPVDIIATMILQEGQD